MLFWRKKEEKKFHPDFALLQSICSGRAVITLRSGDLHGSSLLLEIRPDRILIDSLSPESVQNQLKTGQQVLIQGKHNGIRWQFESRLLGTETDTDATLLPVLAFPKKVVYEQQRQDFRVSIKASINAQVRFLRALGGSQLGTLIDLSPSGFRASIPNMQADLGVGEPLNRGTLILPRHATISFDAVLRNFHFDRRRNQTILGAQFSAKLAEQDQKILQRFLLEMQREQQRTSSE